MGFIKETLANSITYSFSNCPTYFEESKGKYSVKVEVQGDTTTIDTTRRYSRSENVLEMSMQIQSGPTRGVIKSIGYEAKLERPDGKFDEIVGNGFDPTALEKLNLTQLLVVRSQILRAAIIGGEYMAQPTAAEFDTPL